MRIGMVGLGRMGGNMATRLLRAGHEVVVHDRDAMLAEALAGPDGGAEPVRSLAALLAALPAPRVVWVMVPAGAPTEEVIAELGAALEPGDVLVDGGNSRYTDTRRRAARLSEAGVALVDAGTSGGVWGLEKGYCLMVGGEDDAVSRCAPVFETLAMPGGYAHVGPSGAGHFAKMVHNGIEYGMLQAYAEGFELLHAAPFDLDLHELAALWNRGSVVRSWLLELLEATYADTGDDLAGIRGWVDDSGEGRWTVETAIDLDVPTPTLALALFARFRSRQDDSYGARVIAALRNRFGGHALRE